jgi:hypothetical protein
MSVLFVCLCAQMDTSPLVEDAKEDVEDTGAVDTSTAAAAEEKETITATTITITGGKKTTAPLFETTDGHTLYSDPSVFDANGHKVFEWLSTLNNEDAVRQYGVDFQSIVNLLERERIHPGWWHLVAHGYMFKEPDVKPDLEKTVDEEEEEEEKKGDCPLSGVIDHLAKCKRCQAVQSAAMDISPGIKFWRWLITRVEAAFTYSLIHSVKVWMLECCARLHVIKNNRRQDVALDPETERKLECVRAITVHSMEERSRIELLNGVYPWTPETLAIMATSLDMFRILCADSFEPSDHIDVQVLSALYRQACHTWYDPWIAANKKGAATSGGILRMWDWTLIEDDATLSRADDMPFRYANHVVTQKVLVTLAQFVENGVTGDANLRPGGYAAVFYRFNDTVYNTHSLPLLLERLDKLTTTLATLEETAHDDALNGREVPKLKTPAEMGAEEGEEEEEEKEATPSIKKKKLADARFYGFVRELVRQLCCRTTEVTHEDMERAGLVFHKNTAPAAWRSCIALNTSSVDELCLKASINEVVFNIAARLDYLHTINPSAADNAPAPPMRTLRCHVLGDDHVPTDGDADQLRLMESIMKSRGLLREHTVNARALVRDVVLNGPHTIKWIVAMLGGFAPGSCGVVAATTATTILNTVMFAGEKQNDAIWMVYPDIGSYALRNIAASRRNVNRANVKAKNLRADDNKEAIGNVVGHIRSHFNHVSRMDALLLQGLASSQGLAVARRALRDGLALETVFWNSFDPSAIKMYGAMGNQMMTVLSSCIQCIRETDNTLPVHELEAAGLVLDSDVGACLLGKLERLLTPDNCRLWLKNPYADKGDPVVLVMYEEAFWSSQLLSLLMSCSMERTRTINDIQMLARRPALHKCVKLATAVLWGTVSHGLAITVAMLWKLINYPADSVDIYRHPSKVMLNDKCWNDKCETMRDPEKFTAFVFKSLQNLTDDSKPRALSRCGSCKMAYYCGKKCQKADIGNHRETCENLHRLRTMCLQPLESHTLEEEEEGGDAEESKDVEIA